MFLSVTSDEVRSKCSSVFFEDPWYKLQYHFSDAVTVLIGHWQRTCCTLHVHVHVGLHYG